MEDLTLNEKLVKIAKDFTSKLPLATFEIDFRNSKLTLTHLQWKIYVHKDNVDEVILRLSKLIEVNQQDYYEKLYEELEENARSNGKR